MMTMKDYLVWGGVAFGAWLLLRKKEAVHNIPEKMTAKQVVEEAVGPSLYTPIDAGVGTTTTKALEELKEAYTRIYPSDKVIRVFTDSGGNLFAIEAVDASGTKYRASAVLMDLLEGGNELTQEIMRTRKAVA